MLFFSRPEGRLYKAALMERQNLMELLINVENKFKNWNGFGKKEMELYTPDNHNLKDFPDSYWLFTSNFTFQYFYLNAINFWQ